MHFLMPRPISLLTILLFGAALAFTVPFLASQYTDNLSPNALKRFFSRAKPRLEEVAESKLQPVKPPLNTSNMTRTPVYFISHGGPNLFEDYTHPAYAKLQSIGREITTQVKPKAILVLSAHWQGSPGTVQVNTAASQPLIYDYYGFPDHYYKVQYPNTGSPELANKVLTTLKSAGIEASGATRGLDHGVFAPFLVAFDPASNPLPKEVPIVQVSLFDSDSAEAHLALGKALAPLRDEGVLIICSGMAVHNLRDLMGSFGKPGNKAYTVSFDAALREAVEQDGAEAREKAMVALLRRSDARRAHPSFEHLLPVHVAAGAAGGDLGRQIWTLPEGSMSWAQYRFGEVAAGGEGQL